MVYLHSRCLAYLSAKRGIQINAFVFKLSRWWNWQIHPVRNAAVAELADAHGSGPCIRKDMWVQLPPAAFLTGQAPRSGRCKRKLVGVQISPSVYYKLKLKIK